LRDGRKESFDYFRDTYKIPLLLDSMWNFPHIFSKNFKLQLFGIVKAKLPPHNMYLVFLGSAFRGQEQGIDFSAAVPTALPLFVLIGNFISNFRKNL